MNNNKQKAASSLSADSTEVRYQKALKQINKLIAANTQLRDEANKNQQVTTELQFMLQAKGDQLLKVQKQIKSLQLQLHTVSKEKKNLTLENEELQKELLKLKNLKSQSQQLKKRKQGKQEYFGVSKNNQQQKFIISELQKKINNKDQTIKQLIRRVNSTEGCSEDFGDGKMAYSESMKNTPISNDLSKKLTAANDYIQVLSNENVNLKGKLMKVQTTNLLLTSRSATNLSKYSPQVTPRNIVLEPMNSAEVLKRYHKLQQQNKKMSKKFQTMQNQIQALKQGNQKLQKQNKKFQQQIKGYEQLIQKQQDIISDLHKNFDDDIRKMTNQFKQKLLQQRESFSPAKTADNLKTIQTLQLENKSLKKKFQLCSIQLTKCFKTLQLYKVKLSECQKDYSDLLIERDELYDKLTRLQGSHRERSTHSKGSRIIDNQRRNSMGQTGYFNYG